MSDTRSAPRNSVRRARDRAHAGQREVGIEHELPYRRGDFMTVSRVHEQGGVADDFVHRAPGRGDDRRGARHCFKHGQSKSFVH